MQSRELAADKPRRFKVAAQHDLRPQPREGGTNITPGPSQPLHLAQLSAAALAPLAKRDDSSPGTGSATGQLESEGASVAESRAESEILAAAAAAASAASAASAADAELNALWALPPLASSATVARSASRPPSSAAESEGYTPETAAPPRTSTRPPSPVTGAIGAGSSGPGEPLGRRRCFNAKSVTTVGVPSATGIGMRNTTSSATSEAGRSEPPSPSATVQPRGGSASPSMGISAAFSSDGGSLHERVDSFENRESMREHEGARDQHLLERLEWLAGTWQVQQAMTQVLLDAAVPARGHAVDEPGGRDGAADASATPTEEAAAEAIDDASWAVMARELAELSAENLRLRNENMRLLSHFTARISLGVADVGAASDVGAPGPDGGDGTGGACNVGGAAVAVPPAPGTMVAAVPRPPD